MSRRQPAEGRLVLKWRLEINTIHEVLVSKCQNRATTAATTKLYRQHDNTLDNFHIKRLLMLRLRRLVSTSPTHFRSSLPSPTLLTVPRPHQILSLYRGLFDASLIHHDPRYLITDPHKLALEQSLKVCPTQKPHHPIPTLQTFGVRFTLTYRP